MKAKFGDGYKVEIVCKDGTVDAAKRFLAALMPDGIQISGMGSMFTLQALPSFTPRAPWRDAVALSPVHCGILGVVDAEGVRIGG